MFDDPDLHVRGEALALRLLDLQSQLDKAADGFGACQGWVGLPRYPLINPGQRRLQEPDADQCPLPSGHWPAPFPFSDNTN